MYAYGHSNLSTHQFHLSHDPVFWFLVASPRFQLGKKKRDFIVHVYMAKPAFFLFTSEVRHSNGAA